MHVGLPSQRTSGEWIFHDHDARMRVVGIYKVNSYFFITCARTRMDGVSSVFMVCLLLGFSPGISGNKKPPACIRIGGQ